MTIEEFSNEFDILLNSSIAAKKFGEGQTIYELDEYEKSVLLTQAQETIVRLLYDSSQSGVGFEGNEKARRSLDNLVKTAKLSPIATPVIPGVNNESQFFQLPNDVWYITYESALMSDESLGCKNNTYVEVIPVRQDEYHIVKDNPFRGPTKSRVLRIDTGDFIIELISKYNIGTYFIKYLSKPKPIILEDIDDDNLSIEGEKKKQGCELNSLLHRTILEGAVSLAMNRIPSQKNNV